MNKRGLPEQASTVLRKLKKMLAQCNAVLAGGTAAALHLGHRLSKDLDFFTPTAFQNENIWAEIQRTGLPYKVIKEGPEFVIAEVNGIKWSLFQYPYPFLHPSKRVEGVRVAGLLDVAAMKVIAISQRGTKRDFVDLYFILLQIPFHKIAAHMVEWFGVQRINPIHIGKALVYFTDAESDPEPQFFPQQKVHWSRVKNFLQDHVKQFVFDLDAAVRNAKRKK